METAPAADGMSIHGRDRRFVLNPYHREDDALTSRLAALARIKTEIGCPSPKPNHRKPRSAHDRSTGGSAACPVLSERL
jgi:hypothetical protein